MVDSKDEHGKPLAGLPVNVMDKHADNINSLWEQTSDMHTALLVNYHRVCLRQAGSLIIGKE